MTSEGGDGRNEEASHSVEEMGRWGKVGLDGSNNHFEVSGNSINQNDSSLDGNANSLNSGVYGSLQTDNGEGRQLWDVMPMVELQVCQAKSVLSSLVQKGRRMWG
ncbi:hypothetical protein ACFX2A_045673 [Malus domestica]